MAVQHQGVAARYKSWGTRFLGMMTMLFEH
jgi:hypothetical protein